MPKKQKIAIIGTGAAGLTCGYFLHEKFDITLYEKNDYAGGHAHTLALKEGKRTIFTDTAFVIFNCSSYPNFIRLLEELKVSTISCPVATSFQDLPTGLEYVDGRFRDFFVEPKQLFSLRHWKLYREIRRFKKEALGVLKEDYDQTLTIAHFLHLKGYSNDFVYKYFIPLISLIWTIPLKYLMNYPMQTMAHFLNKHTTLHDPGVKHEWLTVEGGSRKYVEKLIAPFKNKILLERAVTKVVRKKSSIAVTDITGGTREFDKVIFASHPGQCLKILKKPTETEASLLGKFTYENAEVVLHTDPAVMPRNKKAWVGWNFRGGRSEGHEYTGSFTYYMNVLQSVSRENDYFVTLNDAGTIDPKKIIKRFVYEHPLFDFDVIKAQRELYSLNENGRVYFCGGYFKYGLHEDAIRSGLEVARLITGEPLWQ